MLAAGAADCTEDDLAQSLSAVKLASTSNDDALISAQALSIVLARVPWQERSSLLLVCKVGTDRDYV